MGRLQKNDNVDGQGGRVEEVVGGLVGVGDGYTRVSWFGLPLEFARAADG